MDRSRLVPVLAVAALLVLAGCGEVATTDTGGNDDGATLAADYRVTVTAVIDGDTVRIQYQNGTRDTVRLLGIDTPETQAENSPDEFEGVPDTAAGRDCLRRAGAAATRYATDRLLGETVSIRFDPQSDRRGYYDRLLAYVVHDGRNLNYQLVARGYARVYDSEFTEADRFYAAETRAQENGTRVWACRSPGDATFTGTAAVERAGAE